jgi:KDO2-lipid IV(A) lauroyltransferase
MSKKRLKNWLIYRFIQLLAFWMIRLPRGAALKFCGFLGRLAYWIVADARRMTAKNLSRTFGWPEGHPRLARMTRGVFINAGKNVADLALIPRLNEVNIDRLIRVKGRHHLDLAMAQGRGVVGITGHIGNWELMAAWVAIKGYPLSAVARRVYDVRLDRILNDLRKNANVRGISRDAGVKEMIRVLRRGEMLGVLMDQDTKVRGVFVPFFGRPAHTPVGPVILAMKTGAVIVPMAIHRQKNETYLITIEQPLELAYTGNREEDILINTTACTSALERLIRLDPVQWVWMHDRWRRGDGHARSVNHEEIFDVS